MQNKKKHNEFDAIVNQILDAFIVTCGYGLWELVKKPAALIVSIPASYIGCKILYPLLLQNQFFPAIIPEKIHFGLTYALLIFPLLFMLGMAKRSDSSKFNRIFKQTGLTNGAGEHPVFLKKEDLDSYRSKYTFFSRGIGPSEYEAKKERIECNFKANIESIKQPFNKANVEIIFTKQNIPEKISYEQLAKSTQLAADSMYLGVSAEGIQTQAISQLPHMLIAGTTGSGKSVFFKQALLGILESTDHLQMYLIDLKGGLEMIDFASAPNVKVIKTIHEAVTLLKYVESEMKNRFAYLEQSNKKQIHPQRDYKDRIVVAVDEASVLYMARDRNDPDYDSSLEARRLADSISKLSRAAAIHLMIATQKLDKQVIPTSVSENISGRMAFRANSLQGSMIVLGTKDAMELPEIPGRGIWSHGTKKMIIQTPFVDEKIIRQRCDEIKKQFDAGVRKLFTPMLNDVAKNKSKSNSSIVYET